MVITGQYCGTWITFSIFKFPGSGLDISNIEYRPQITFNYSIFKIKRWILQIYVNYMYWVLTFNTSYSITQKLLLLILLVILGSDLVEGKTRWDKQPNSILNNQYVNRDPDPRTLRQGGIGNQIQISIIEIWPSILTSDTKRILSPKPQILDSNGGWYSSFWSEGPKNHLNLKMLVSKFVPPFAALRGPMALPIEVLRASLEGPWRRLW